MLVLEQENSEGRTPLTIAIMAKAAFEVLEKLVEHQHSVLKATDVLFAIEKHLDIESLTLILENFSSGEEELKDGYGRNIVHAGISSGAGEDVMELLVERYSKCCQESDPLTGKHCVELAHQSEATDKTLLLLLSNCAGSAFKTSITFIASKCNDARNGVLEEYLQASTQEHRLKCAVMRTGGRNSKLVTVSTPLAKQCFKTSLRYLGRYELSAVPVSRDEESGVEVFRAVDYGVGGGTEKVDVVLKFAKELAAVEDELYARKKLDNKFINRILDTFATSTGFVVSFPNATTLEELLEATPDGSRVEDRKAVKWVYSIAKALASMHAAGIAHGELCEKNVGVTREGRWSLLSVGASVRKAREAALQDPHSVYDDEAKARDDAESVVQAMVAKNGTGKQPLPFSPQRKNFGSVANRSPIRFQKFDNTEQLAKDIVDLGKIACRLFGVPQEAAKETTMTAKVSSAVHCMQIRERSTPTPAICTRSSVRLGGCDAGGAAPSVCLSTAQRRRGAHELAEGLGVDVVVVGLVGPYHVALDPVCHRAPASRCGACHS
jgi:hypothetical protein